MTDVGITCPAGLGGGTCFGCLLGQVRLATNTLLVKRGLGWELT